MNVVSRKLLRWGKMLPILALYQSFGCLPDNAFTQVLGENIVLTAAIAIQSLSSIFFNTLFGFI
jgi:hypothetical protein